MVELIIDNLLRIAENLISKCAIICMQNTMTIHHMMVMIVLRLR